MFNIYSDHEMTIDYVFSIFDASRCQPFFAIDDDYIYQSEKITNDKEKWYSRIVIMPHRGTKVIKSKHQYRNIAQDGQYLYGEEFVRTKYHIYPKNNISDEEIGVALEKKGALLRTRIIRNRVIEEVLAELKNSPNNEITTHAAGIAKNQYDKVDLILPQHFLIRENPIRSIYRIRKDKLPQILEEKIIETKFPIMKMVVTDDLLILLLRYEEHVWRLDCYDKETFTKQEELFVENHEIFRVRVDYDDDYLYANTSGHGTQLRIWDLHTLKEVKTIQPEIMAGRIWFICAMNDYYLTINDETANNEVSIFNKWSHELVKKQTLYSSDESSASIIMYRTTFVYNNHIYYFYNICDESGRIISTPPPDEYVLQNQELVKLRTVSFPPILEKYFRNAAIWD